ncbi:metal transporter family GufA protein [Halosimplex carlsbadense 2-9-1]|uniref:Metal transporter family GufA protein n=1 Tax=Halosimplex carlsbadense 2-9-1 TaxID=797114 RepID=M0D4M3_9EURY|nr:ZIP family metal transporter [Halosimplex carlsbadense]ELZ29632.1 metal transporter family GufA protein [Halosimplex carlsbadense 2-9-1]
MVDLGNLGLVFLAGLLTALATGLGALPFFLVEDISDRWNVVLWGLASGIMVAASLFGLIREGLAVVDGGFVDAALAIGPGVLVGVLLVVVAHELLEGAEFHPKEYEEADFRKLVLILGILTVHSFPEGVAVGVSFAELGIDDPSLATVTVGSLTLPVLAVFMTVAISIHNVPEGVAISIPLRSMGVSEWRMAWWAVFSSLPQPLGAVIAYYFVTLAEQFLPFGFGFAAGAMVYLVATEFVPEALERGSDLPGGGRRELLGGIAAGVLVMVPLAFA